MTRGGQGAMKVVVTGATGFVGSALVAALRARGDTVIVLSRDGGHARAVLGDIATVTADLQTPGAWCEELAGIDAVAHLAGESIAGKRWDARQKQRLRESRVESTRTLVDAIGALPAPARPRVLVTASGADYYPFAPDTQFDDDEVTEADPAGDSFLARLCAAWEAEAQRATIYGLRVVCMRTGMVLGPGGALAKLLPIFQRYAGGRIGSGRQWMPWIHRDDAVAAYVAALTNERYIGPINLVTSSVRNAEFARALGKAVKRPAWLPVPGFALRAALGEMADYVLAGRRVVPRRLSALGFTWRQPTLEAALASSIAEAPSSSMG